jgi:cobalt/nickel transport system permease protein
MLRPNGMHIPDGYLSPSTCATLCAAAAPFWYVALKRIRKTLTTRTVPLLAVFAAFSFVIMMFNLPVPGGTTAHAVGMGMSAVLLGPFVSILSLSVALFIQCLFFGDGGITTFGANCFNMAILGSLSAYVVYRILSRGAEIDSTRRMIAAGFAGYVGMNVAALCAAIEFGIRPLLFREASGVPLYAPYPLSVSIPAMMIGHLTFAGFAEFIVSAGVVRYVQQIDPSLLRATALDVPTRTKYPGTFQKKPNLPAWRKLGLNFGIHSDADSFRRVGRRECLGRVANEGSVRFGRSAPDRSCLQQSTASS